MESHSAGLPPFPHSVEIPSGLPHSHGHGGETRYLEDKYKSRESGATLRKVVVTDVPGPRCNGGSGTLTPQQGLVSLQRAERRRLRLLSFLLLAEGRCGEGGPPR